MSRSNFTLKKIASNLLKPIILLYFDKEMIDSFYFKRRRIGYLWALKSIWQRNILRLATPHSFPVSLGTTISNEKNLIFHYDDLNNFQSFGIYFQNFNASITIGRGTYIGPNVGLITSNHKYNNLDSHTLGKSIILGDECWIGMNSVILPGVVLGKKTIVGAGSVVTKSFTDGDCLIAGNPAKLIKKYNET